MHCTQCGQALADDEQFCPRCGAPRETSGMTFEQAEQEYFSLRGQLDTHRITPQQFDSALKALMIQDAQGRYWMPGADSGQWYVHDGQQWVRAAPNAQSVSSPNASPRTPASNRNLWYAIIALVLFGLVAVGAFLFLQMGHANVPALNANVALLTTTPTAQLVAAQTGAPLPTLLPIVPTPLPPTNAFPTLAPTATNSPPTVALPTAFPETVIVVESNAPTLASPQAPAQTPMPTLEPPTETLTPTITRVLPTRPPAPTATLAPTEIPSPAYPPGVYVTQIKTEPGEPKRNQGVAFRATFLNTTGATQQYNWLIQIYDAESNKRFGETLVLPLTVPPGESVQTSPNNWQVTGAGGCISLYAQAQFQNADTGRIPFTTTNGDTLVQGFNVCP